MPNWCNNVLSIQGPKIEEVLRAIAGENGAMDLQKIVPMPEAIKNTKSGMDEEVALSCAKNDLSHWKDMPWVTNSEISTTRQIAEHFRVDYDEAVAYGKRLLQNLQQYGATTWYDWCWQNWGCKWNTLNSEAVKLSETSGRVDFITPWSPPTPAIRALASEFPDHSFTLTYADFEGGTAGLIEVKGEKTIRDEDLEVVYEPIVDGQFDSSSIEDGWEAPRLGDEEDIPF